MGFAIPHLYALMHSRRGRAFSGSLLQIGRQDVYFDYRMLRLCAQSLGFPLRTPPKIVTRPNEWMTNLDTIDDTTLFQALGFDEVFSLDASDYESPDFVADLNLPVREELADRFDVVYDGGSFEHIFHLPNALKNLVCMTKVGGTIIHHTPTHNFVDHGFYSISPTFYYDYYEANHCENLYCVLAGQKLPFRHNDVPTLFPYTPGALEAFSIGGFTRENFKGCDMFMTAFEATKTEVSVGDVIPVQRRYQQWWAKAKAGIPLSASS